MRRIGLRVIRARTREKGEESSSIGLRVSFSFNENARGTNRGHG
jgi:hypothetical protein